MHEVLGRAADKRGSGKEIRFADAASSIGVSRLAGREATPSQHAAGTEFGEQMDATLQKIPERSRELIIRRYYCHMPYDEIAEEMELAGAHSARAMYSRAVREWHRLVRDE